MREISGRVTGVGTEVSGIVVSDGYSVTSTDDAGAFTLPVVGPFVFVTRPTGFTADPWFVRATTSEPGFTLTREDQPVPFRFLHITDLHLSGPPSNGESEGVAGLLRLSDPEDLSDFLRREHADFVVATGDLTNQGVPGELRALAEVARSSPLAIHLLPGNHDHMNGVHNFVTTESGAVENEADTRGYEERIGPRWYSFDYGGVHFVALDWHSWLLGIDGEVQLRWLDADLAEVEADAPWILLFHDQPSRELMERLPRPPVATFSGHRHSDRMVALDGVLHVNTPTTFFAGLDSSPPTYRIASWNGSALGVSTVTAGTAHLHQPALGAASAGVVVGSDRGVEAFAVDTLAPQWITELGAPVRGRPLVVGSTIVAVTVTGQMVALDAHDGSVRWEVSSADPWQQWAFNDPVTNGTHVIAGDLSELCCVDISDGALRWRILDMGTRSGIVSRASCVIVDDLVVGGFWPGAPSRFALDITDGALVWENPAAGSSFADEFTGPAPQATPRLDPQTGWMIAPGAQRVDAVVPQTGETAWSVPLPTFFNVASPVITEAGIALTLPGRGIVLLDRRDGSERWSIEISGPTPFAMVPYQRTPTSPVFASPCLVGDVLALPGLDGLLRILDPEKGSCRRTLPIGVPVAAPPLAVGGRVIVRGTDGSLRAVEVGGD